MEKIDFIINHFEIQNTEGKNESVRQWLNRKKLDDEDLIFLLEAYEKFILHNVVEQSEQLCQCDDAPTKHFIKNWCDDCKKHIV